MTALACLKIVVGEIPASLRPETMPALVSRVANAYLAARWAWPRRYGEVAPFAFALADPRATRLDAAELQRLAADIHLMLFGRESAGEVDILMLEGEQGEVMRFAGASNDALAALLKGRDDGTFKGRICKITPDGVVSLSPVGGPVDGSPSGEELSAPVPRTTSPTWPASPAGRSRWSGVYLPAREQFIGSIAASPMWDDVGALTPPEDEIMVQDMACLRLATEVMPEAATGVVFVPMNFSGLIRPSLRQAYAPALATVKPGWRSRIAASVYETPRVPTLTALRQVQDLLRPVFSLVDLQVTDPSFEIEALPVRMVTSVSLVLGAHPERERLAAINRFASAAPSYRSRRVLQGVMSVRTPREVELCLRLKLAFLAGPGVSRAALRPWGEVPCPANELPYR